MPRKRNPYTTIRADGVPNPDRRSSSGSKAKKACLTLLDELARMTASDSEHPVHRIADRLIKANYYAWVGDDSAQAMKEDNKLEYGVRRPAGSSRF